MKLLKIENNLGHFRDENGQYVPLDKITKDDLLKLVDLTLSEDVEFDEFNVELLKNQAHQILYKSVYEKLKGLEERKQEFLDQSQRLYLQEYEKYMDNPTTAAVDLEE